MRTRTYERVGPCEVIEVTRTTDGGRGQSAEVVTFDTYCHACDEGGKKDPFIAQVVRLVEAHDAAQQHATTHEEDPR